MISFDDLVGKLLELRWHFKADKIASDYLPQPTTLHPWPQMRFAVTHPRWEPRAGIPLARFCAGGRSVTTVPCTLRVA